MWEFLKWFILIEFLGWITYPISFILFNRLSDKGFTISKILGLLIWGYLYWLANTFGLASNSTAGAVLFLLLIALGSIILLKNRIGELLSFMKEISPVILFFEFLFLLAFAFMAFFRSLAPEIIGTEKPMELAFINAIYRSPGFPPNDPWLSGYAISYYYFGYMLVAMIMHVTGTVSGIAFNLSVSLWFALITITSAGLLFNLISAKKVEAGPNNRKFLPKLLLSLFAPLMILLMSNAEGFLEILHARGIFWNFTQDGLATSGFWRWLDIQELTRAPSLPLSWQPNRIGGTWWWRASRVLLDYDLMGNPREIIDEFPFFSFLLADFHPHVISIPFVLLILSWIYSSFSQVIKPIKRISLSDPIIWVSGFFCGSLIFINTWDFPIYAGLLIILFGMGRYLAENEHERLIREIVSFAISIGICSIALYIPFLLGLSSQAGGFLPSLIYRTRGIHFLVMFFPQIIFISWMMLNLIKNLGISSIFRYFLVILLGSVVLFSISLLFIYLYGEIPNLIKAANNLLNINTGTLSVNWQSNVEGLLGIYGSQNTKELIAASIQGFLTKPMVLLIIIGWIAIVIAFLSVRSNKNTGQTSNQDSNFPFLLAMLLVGSLLCLVPEFFYLRDQFGWRMNTIFKFYFQAWTLLSLVSSYFIAAKFLELKHEKPRRWIFSGSVVLVLSISLVYPFFAIKERLENLSGRNITLDGNAFNKLSYPEEYDAIQFLKEIPYGVITEAIGGSYTNYGRISRLTGLPTVLGWPGHELQWRGGVNEIGSRQSDIETLYSTNSWDIARNIIGLYQIDYIYIGPLEKSTYSVNENKFLENLPMIYENRDIKIYAANR